jgi:hypothetical protein
MAEYNVQLRGWHALVAIVALIGFTGFKMYLRVRPVEDGVRDAIRLSLLNEYSGRGPKDVARELHIALNKRRYRFDRQARPNLAHQPIQP